MGSFPNYLFFISGIGTGREKTGDALADTDDL